MYDYYFFVRFSFKIVCVHQVSISFGTPQIWSERRRELYPGPKLYLSLFYRIKYFTETLVLKSVLLLRTKISKTDFI